MKKNTWQLGGWAVFLAILVSGFILIDERRNADAMQPLETIALEGASVLSFGPEHVLFIGDSQGGMIHAVATEANEVKDPVPFNYTDFDLQIAEALDISPRDLIVQDMRIHPVSQEAYVAVKKRTSA